MELECACFVEGERDTRQSYAERIERDASQVMVLQKGDSHRSAILGHMIVEAWPGD
jgi:hypothetical protein